MDFFSGTTSATDLIGNVSTSVSGTLESLFPIIGAVAGIALAIMLVPVMVGWFKKAVSAVRR